MANSTSQDVNSFSSNWKKLKQSLDTADRTEVKERKKRDHSEIAAELGKEQSSKNLRSAKRIKKMREQTVDVESAVEGTSGEANLPKFTKALAMDCEFVGVGEDGVDNMLARVSLVNSHGDCVYDKFVKPTEPVTDYRTAVSGVRKEDLVSGEDFAVVQKEVCDLIEGRRLVGHAIHNDLKILHLSHRKREIRDTSKYKPFRAIAQTRHPSLKKLCRLVLGIRIQDGEHDSICDARSAMQLYQLHKRQWETRSRNPRKERPLQKALVSAEDSQETGQRSTKPRRHRVIADRNIDWHKTSNGDHRNQKRLKRFRSDIQVGKNRVF